MSTILGNTPSEMLHLLVDGELDSSQESILFSQLAESEELQTEMKDLLSIRDSVQNDIEAYTPPVEATQGVFARLGFNNPQTNPVPAPIPHSGGFMSNFLRKAWLPVATAIVASVGTFLLLQNNDEMGFAQDESNIPVSRSVDNNDYAAQSGNIIENAITNGAKSISRFSSISGIQNYDANSDQYSKSTADNTTANYNASYMSSPSFAVQIFPLRNRNAVNAQSDDADDIQLAMLSYAKPARSSGTDIFESNNSLNFGEVEKDFYPMAISSGTGKKGLSFAVRGIHAESYPGSNLPSKAYPIFSNMSIGMHYDLSDNFQAGIELGQEPFGQILRTETEITYQNPMVFWGAASLKYRAGQQLFNLAGAEPFAQMMVGGTEMGPVVKGIVGLQFISSDWGFGMNFGVEGTTLIYDFNDELNRTDKLGLTYGIIYSF